MPNLEARLAAVGVLLAFVACGPSALDRASASYKRDRDCPSLELIAKEIRTGTSRERVEALLGPAGYEPTPGQHYYSSTDPDCSLFLEFRREERLTDTVQFVELGPIRE